MSLKYIRDYYKVSVKRGQVIIFEYDNGLEYKGYITSGEGSYIRVRIETCSDGHIKNHLLWFYIQHLTLNIWRKIKMDLQIKNEQKKVNINLIEGEAYLVISQWDNYKGIAFIIEKDVIVVYEHADYIPSVMKEFYFFRKYNIIRKINLEEEEITITLDDMDD